MVCTIGKTFYFDAAHRLPKHKGACSNLHGHTWTVTVEVVGEVDLNTGMVLDFEEFEAAVEVVLREYDHTNLSQDIPNPTCEVLAYTLYNKIMKEFDATENFQFDSLKVKVQEGQGGWAIYQGTV